MSLPPSSFSHCLPRPYPARKGREVATGDGSVELRCLPSPPKARSNEPQAEFGEERGDSGTPTRRKGADGGERKSTVGEEEWRRGSGATSRDRGRGGGAAGGERGWGVAPWWGEGRAAPPVGEE
uniref:Uncharacterized protein n=1 Tax=Oryza punctata TaxID=4537 RepID=A0A0E0MLC3_ORYPU